jgi:outer membrane protein OmpA-like peptidoglycan-associated protein
MRQDDNTITAATRFNIDLANAYIDKASEFSYSDNGGWNSLRMEEKASQAASGQTVQPYIANAELIGSETFADKLNALRDAFTNLLYKYPTDTKLDNPKLTASTQAALDCWILGNTHEVDKSFNQSICKRQFLDGLGKLIKITKNHMTFKNFSEDVNSVFFRFDSYYLTEDSIYRLNKTIKELHKVTGATLMLHGYTDNVGSPVYNKFLAQQRINTVKKFLIDSGTITKNNICIDEVILGEFDPLISQQTVNNNPHSRRVDIFVMR